MDRTIHFGDDAADARYRIQDTSSTGGDFVLAEDLDGGTVLLEYDYSASEWVSRGPVNLSGNDITNAGAITADSLEAEDTTNTKSQVIERGDVSSLTNITSIATKPDSRVINDDIRENITVGSSSTTTIHDDLTRAGGRSVRILLVSGENQANDDETFFDLIVTGRRYGTVNVITSLSTSAASSRTYSTGSFANTLDLQMSSETYTVGIRGIEGAGANAY